MSDKGLGTASDRCLRSFPDERWIGVLGGGPSHDGIQEEIPRAYRVELDLQYTSGLGWETAITFLSL